MVEVGPLMVAAHSKQHAEYLIASRAEQRRVAVERIEVTGGNGEMWSVVVQVGDQEDATVVARLADDTTVLHFNTHHRQGS